ncbi:MAG: cytochrome b561, partial [Rheinheimera aquimaris]
MSIGNTADQWGLLSKTLHWLTALLIFIQIPLGFYAESLKLSALKMDVFIWHKSVGMLVFLLLILRLLWRINSTIPEAFGISQIQQRLGQLAHGLLYGLMV